MGLVVEWIVLVGGLAYCIVLDWHEYIDQLRSKTAELGAGSRLQTCSYDMLRVLNDCRVT